MNKSRQHSNYKNNWATPSAIVWEINETLTRHGWPAMTLDVACSKENTKCAFYYTEENNSLHPTTEWVVEPRHYQTLWWCNPPFQKVEAFLIKAHEELAKGHEGIMLVPSGQETKWFRQYIVEPNLPRLVWPHRISFIHPETGKPCSGNTVGSVLVGFVKEPEKLPRIAGQPWVTNLPEPGH